MTYLRLLRSTRLIRTLAEALDSAVRASRASARAAFFWESFSARFWASMDRVEREADIAAGGVFVIFGFGGYWRGEGGGEKFESTECR